MMEYFRDERLRPPASEVDLAQLDQDLGFRLPDDYRAFLLVSDGYNGYVGVEGYADLWSSRRVASDNEGYEGEILRGRAHAHRLEWRPDRLRHRSP